MNAGKLDTRRMTGAETPPDPFEDIAAPPMRLTPRPERARLVSVAPPAEPEAEPERIAPPAHGAAEGPATIRALKHQARSGGSRRDIALALLVGLAIAAAIVAAAVFFRPATSVPTATSLGSGPVPALDVSPTPVSDVVVTLHVPGSIAAERTEALRDALAAAGFARVEVATETAPIAASRIAYAHAEDRAAAETLAAALAPLAGGALAAEAVEGGSAGRVDLWIQP